MEVQLIEYSFEGLDFIKVFLVLLDFVVWFGGMYFGFFLFQFFYQGSWELKEIFLKMLKILIVRMLLIQQD